ncbi:hypothetical protein [Chondrinema litorale]|uniref:hypothetical protein n=1 Tax=Chondrinema litorale TaxID=2994555 RepID=UPI002543E332|nr:hypothetical protein [Chondrinema litorale]UZR92730.1 hypothetical protein OQ292_12765 [Chondrinema litorale]
MNFKVILLSIGAVFFIIGVHQSFYFGIQASYWAFMISGVCFLWVQYIKKKEEEEEKKSAGTNKNPKNRKRK